MQSKTVYFWAIKSRRFVFCPIIDPVIAFSGFHRPKEFMCCSAVHDLNIICRKYIILASCAELLTFPHYLYACHHTICPVGCSSLTMNCMHFVVQKENLFTFFSSTKFVYTLYRARLFYLCSCRKCRQY